MASAMITKRSFLVAFAVIGLVLAGCSDDDTTSTETTPAPVGQESNPATTTGPSTRAAQDTTAAGSGQALSGCERLQEAPDGVYRFEAGEVDMSREGDRLVLGDVRPAEGWTHSVDEQGDDEIEIDFRRDGREIDFEAEIDDGRLDIEICADQND